MNAAVYGSKTKFARSDLILGRHVVEAGRDLIT